MDPAYPRRSISFVADTFNDNRSSVVSRSNDGKTENCNGSVRYMVTSRTPRENAMLSAKSTSSKTGGMGTTIIKRMSKTMTAIRMSPRFMYWRNSVRPPPRASPILSTPSDQKIIVSSATTGKQRPIPPQRLGKAQEESPGQSRLT